MPTIPIKRGESHTDFPIILCVQVPTIRPAVTKAGDILLIYRDRVDIVRTASADRDEWLAQWMQGAISPASDADTVRMYELARVSRNNQTNPQPVATSTARAPRLVLERSAIDAKDGAQ